MQRERKKKIERMGGEDNFVIYTSAFIKMIMFFLKTSI